MDHAKTGTADRSHTPHIIAVTSRKGGVGKTTISVNMAIALKSRGYKVLLVDADTTNPSATIHLGMTYSNKSLHQLLTRDSAISDHVTVHRQSGIHLIAGSLSRNPVPLTQEAERMLFDKILKSDYDFAIIDTGPGYTAPPAFRYDDGSLEILFVTTPSEPSLASVIRSVDSADSLGIKHRLAVNMVNGKPYQLTEHEIMHVYGGEMVGMLPEDEVVPRSVAENTPAMLLNKRARFSRAVAAMCTKYMQPSGAGYPQHPRNEEYDSGRRAGILGIFQSIFRLFRHRRS